MDDFLLRALLAGLGVAVVAGPLGSFLVWRRMAYFGDTLAHSALLGVTLGVILGIDVTLGVLIGGLVVALSLAGLQRERRLASDTLLGILAHGTLSVGLVLVAFQENLRIDLMGYLFGDILAVAPLDLVWVYAGAGVVLVALRRLWRPLLAATVDEELARVEGVRIGAVRVALMLLIALVIAVSMKLVGVLLITALLIIPAAAARRWARTPEQMAAFASVLGCLAVAGGLGGSLRWDTPTGPSIVVAALILFLALQFLPFGPGAPRSGAR